MATRRTVQVMRTMALLMAFGVARLGCGQVAVTVRVGEAGRELPADYLGLSFEMERMLPDAKGIYYFRGDNRPLVNLFKTLGVKSLRVGGNTADRATVKIPGEQDIDQL